MLYADAAPAIIASDSAISSCISRATRDPRRLTDIRVTSVDVVRVGGFHFVEAKVRRARGLVGHGATYEVICIAILAAQPRRKETGRA